MLNHMIVLLGLPASSDGKEFACNVGETWLRSLGWENHLQKGITTYSRFPA